MRCMAPSSPSWSTRTSPASTPPPLTGGGEQNLVRIQRGEAEISIIYTFNALQVYTGKGELKVPAPDLRHVMSLYGSYHTPIVHKDSPMQTLADVLKYKSRVWMGSRASVFWALNEAALNAHGVTLDAIPKAGGIIDTMAFANQNQAFQDRKIDVGFYSGPAPYGLMMELDRNPGFRMLEFRRSGRQRYMELLPGTGMAVAQGRHLQERAEGRARAVRLQPDGHGRQACRRTSSTRSPS